MTKYDIGDGVSSNTFLVSNLQDINYKNFLLVALLKA